MESTLDYLLGSCIHASHKCVHHFLRRGGAVGADKIRLPEGSSSIFFWARENQDTDAIRGVTDDGVAELPRLEGWVRIFASDIELEEELGDCVVGHGQETVESPSQFAVDNLLDLVRGLDWDESFKIIRNFYWHCVVDLVLGVRDGDQVDQVASHLEKGVHSLGVDVCAVLLAEVEASESYLKIFAGWT